MKIWPFDRSSESSFGQYINLNLPLLSSLAPAAIDGHVAVPQGAGLGIELNGQALERDDLCREITAGPGLAHGRRAMDDHWAVEEIR